MVVVLQSGSLWNNFSSLGTKFPKPNRSSFVSKTGYVKSTWLQDSDEIRQEISLFPSNLCDYFVSIRGFQIESDASSIVFCGYHIAGYLYICP